MQTVIERRKGCRSQLNPLVGEYDLIVKVKGNSREEIGEFVIGKVRTVDGVIDTKTLLGTLMS